MKFLFALGQTPFDSTSGAAQASLHLAVHLAAGGNEVVFLATSGTEGPLPEDLPVGGFEKFGVRFVIFPVEEARKHSWHYLVGEEYAAYFRSECEVGVDWLVTFGDEEPDRERRRLAREHGVRVLFGLHNQHYAGAMPEEVDLFLSPSRFLSDFYAQHWGDGSGIATFPTPVVPDLVRARSPDPVFVSFVNPQPAKGLYFMIRLAEQIGRHAPEIPLRIVGGRLPAEALASAARANGIELTEFENIYLAENYPDVRDFWVHNRILLMPSVWDEPAGRMPVEAAINGSIALVSPRGGLPEQVACSEFVLPVPEDLTPESERVPSAAEVRPWFERIVVYCEDERVFEEAVIRARAGLARFDVGRWMPGLLERLASCE